MASFFSRFNPTPSFPPYSGRYDVGTVDFEVAASDLQDTSSLPPPVSTLAFRCFYPCDPPSKPARPVFWVQSPQKSILSAYARFAGASSAFSNIFAYFPRLLYWIELPVHCDASPLPSPHENKRWPVVIFSHGLGGSRNSYSHLCASLASHGLVVIATEHRDGSTPISHIRATEQFAATTVDYTRISHKPSKEVYEGRDQQLRTRLWEMGQIYQALVQINSDQTIENLAATEKYKSQKQAALSSDKLNSMFCGLLDIQTPGAVTWAGHSFGAVTTVQFLKSVFYWKDGVQSHLLRSHPSEALQSQITPRSPAMLLDLWALPLNSPASTALKAKPMPCFDPENDAGGITTLAVLSEAFFNWSSNLRDVKAALSDPLSGSLARPAAHIFYPRKSAHLSQSDFGILFPRLTKYVAKADEPERTLKLNVRAILQVLRNVGVEVAETSAEDLELSGDAAAATNNDWRILSKEEGAVRGWVALSADGDNADLDPPAVKTEHTNGHISEAPDAIKVALVETNGDDGLVGAGAANSRL